MFGDSVVYGGGCVCDADVCAGAAAMVALGVAVDFCGGGGDCGECGADYVRGVLAGDPGVGFAEWDAAPDLWGGGICGGVDAGIQFRSISGFLRSGGTDVGNRSGFWIWERERGADSGDDEAAGGAGGRRAVWIWIDCGAGGVRGGDWGARGGAVCESSPCKRGRGLRTGGLSGIGVYAAEGDGWVDAGGHAAGGACD